MRRHTPRQPPRGTAQQYIAGMCPAKPTLHDQCDQSGGRLAGRLSLLLCLCLGLPLTWLAGCGKPEPGAPAPAASALGNPPAQAPSSIAAADPLPAALPANIPASAAAAAETSPPVADSPASQPVAALPPAVIAFQKQRDACDHFRGEEPYDKQRAAFLKAQLAKTCKGSDRALAALRKRFANDPGALAALKGYEDRIE